MNTRFVTRVISESYPARAKGVIRKTTSAGAKLASRFGQNKDQNFEKKIQLDELGTIVWDMIDGNRSVQQIIEEFSEKYRVHLKEAEVAVTSFIKTLGKRELIGLK